MRLFQRGWTVASSVSVAHDSDDVGLPRSGHNSLPIFFQECDPHCLCDSGAMEVSQKRNATINLRTCTYRIDRVSHRRLESLVGGRQNSCIALEVSPPRRL